MYGFKKNEGVNCMSCRFMSCLVAIRHNYGQKFVSLTGLVYKAPQKVLH